MRLLFVCLVVFATALSVAPAWAQSTDAARSASARSLFEEGVKNADAGAWPEAADRFQRALEMRDSQVIRYNLAAALSELGRLVEASELLRQVDRDQNIDPALRADVQSKLEVVSARIAKLTVALDPPDSEVTVVLDGHPLASALLGVAMPTDPGEHSLRAMRGQEEMDTQQVTLTDGAEQSVTLATKRVATPSEAAAMVPLAAPVEEPTSDQDHRDGRRSKLLWWGVGAGVVAVVAIAVVSAMAINGSSDSGSKTYQGDFDPPSVPVKVQP